MAANDGNDDKPPAPSPFAQTVAAGPSPFGQTVAQTPGPNAQGFGATMPSGQAGPGFGATMPSGQAFGTTMPSGYAGSSPNAQGVAATMPGSAAQPVSATMPHHAPESPAPPYATQQTFSQPQGYGQTPLAHSYQPSPSPYVPPQVGPTMTVQPPAPPQAWNQPAPSQPAPKPKSKRWLIVGLLLILAVAGAVVAIMLVPRSEPTRDDIRACDDGVGSACAAMARQYDLEKNVAQATEMFARACQHGDRSSCSEAGFRLDASNRTRAIELLGKACPDSSPDPRACVRLGQIFGLAPALEKRNPQRAVELYERGCKAGNQEACTGLGLHLEDGFGIEPDHKRAATLFRTACDAKVGVACHRLAAMTSMGQGTTFDTKLAVELYRKACDAGDARGCLDAGWYLVYGFGVPVDETVGDELGARGLKLATEQCGKSNARACTTAGLIHFHAVGTQKNPKLVAEFLDKACKGGDVEGCWNLGTCLREAIGVEKDDKRGREWEQIACEAGSDGACSSWARTLADDGDLAKAKTIATRALRGGGDNGYGELVQVRVAEGKTAKEPRAVVDAAVVELDKRGCSSGDAESCYGLAAWTNVDVGTTKANPVEALRLAKQGCAMGSRAACIFVATLSEKTDPRLAREIEERACRRSGGSFGCIELGKFLAQKEPKRSNEAYELACKASPSLCIHEGIIYFHGKQVEKDMLRAYAAFGKACEAGVGNACDWKAHILDGHSDGAIVPNKAQIKELRAKACKLGVEKACKQ